MNSLKWLEEWFHLNCNVDWEHGNGIKITTLDNPGWLVEIDLESTNNENKHFEEIKVDTSTENWIYCKVENNRFSGFGGVNNLSDILNEFQKWSLDP